MPLFSPVSAGGVPKATVTGTTGSPNVDTTTRSGKTIYKFTGSGTITVGTAGTAEILVIGGGGGAIAGGAGAGGMLSVTGAFLESGTLTVTVGAGGGAGVNGNTSRLGNYYGIGGGAGGNSGASGNVGGSGGGAQGTNVPGSAGTPGQGNAGGGGGTGGGVGGGGGAGGVGGTSVSGGIGVRGVGLANSITGVSVTYAQGGQRDTGTAAANLGFGGNGDYTGATNTGGSGIVIVVTG